MARTMKVRGEAQSSGSLCRSGENGTVCRHFLASLCATISDVRNRMFFERKAGQVSEEAASSAHAIHVPLEVKLGKRR